MKRPRLNALRTFEAAGRHLSFSIAGSELGVSQAAVSQQIKRLEEQFETDSGIQVLGGHGFIREHPVEMWYRNARTLGVLEGTLSV